jgi:adenylate kinase family enzyme
MTQNVDNFCYNRNMHKIFFLIGSSGSGKTTIAKAVENMNVDGLIICRSDSVKVPSTEEMVKEYGSTDEWQRTNTIKWVKKIKEEYLESSNVLFDIQSRPSFIQEACQKNGVVLYEIILLDCSDEERKRRLIQERNQPDLATDRMMDWARYLREACVGRSCHVVDNTNLTVSQSVTKLLEIINK